MKQLFFLFILSLTLICGCKSTKKEMQPNSNLFAEIEPIINTKPQKALDMLNRLHETPNALKSKREEMKFYVLFAKALDKTYNELPTDSIMRAAASFFSKEGTKKEAMEAAYYCGRSMHTRHQYHEALKYYYTAIDMANDNEVDSLTMACIYSQLSNIYDHQEHFKSLKDAIRMEMKYRPDILSIHELGRAFSKCRETDSASYFFDKSFHMICNSPTPSTYNLIGEQLAFFVNIHQPTKAIRRLQLLDTVPENLLPSNALYAIGLYREEYGSSDKAIRLWEKCIKESAGATIKHDAAIGLFHLYHERNEPEKALYYALLVEKYAKEMETQRRHSQTYDEEIIYQNKEYQEGIKRLQKEQDLLHIYIYVLIPLLILVAFGLFHFLRKYVNARKETHSLNEKCQKDKETLCSIREKTREFLSLVKTYLSQTPNDNPVDFNQDVRNNVFHIIDIAYPELAKQTQELSRAKNKNMVDVIYLHTIGISTGKIASILNVSRTTVHRAISLIKEEKDSQESAPTNEDTPDSEKTAAANETP